MLDCGRPCWSRLEDEAEVADGRVPGKGGEVGVHAVGIIVEEAVVVVIDDLRRTVVRGVDGEVARL